MLDENIYLRQESGLDELLLLGWNYVQRAVLSFSVPQPSIPSLAYMTLTAKVHERYGGHYNIHPIFGD